MRHRSRKTKKREPYRMFWHRVLGHRFSPDAVWVGYDMKAEKQIFRSG